MRRKEQYNSIVPLSWHVAEIYGRFWQSVAADKLQELATVVRQLHHAPAIARHPRNSYLPQVPQLTQRSSQQYSTEVCVQTEVGATWRGIAESEATWCVLDNVWNVYKSKTRIHGVFQF